MSIQEFDFDRIERGADYVEKALSEKSLPEIQRAVLRMLFLHPASKQAADKMRSIVISLRPAADWLRANVLYLKTYKVDHTSVSKALQAWCDRGVVQVIASGSRRTWWLAIERLQAWYDMQPDADELPVFGALTAVDHCRPVLTGVDRCRPLIEENKKENSYSHSSSSNGALPNQQRSTVVNGGQQNPDESLTGIEVPDAVWMANGDAALWRALTAWQRTDQLAERFKAGGDVDALKRLVGLVVISRTRENSMGYFATCIRNGLRPEVLARGRQFIASQQSTQPTKAAHAGPIRVA
mgnify:CR=1 FL=1